MTSLAPSSTDVVVRVSGFVKRYKHHLAVDGLDFTVNRGEIYGLIGPDGAGKSTVMKAIAGVLGYEEDPPRCSGSSWIPERAAEQVKRRIDFSPRIGTQSTPSSPWREHRLLRQAQVGVRGRPS